MALPKKLKQVFVDDPEVLTALNQQEQAKMLEALLRKDYENKEIPNDFFAKLAKSLLSKHPIKGEDYYTEDEKHELVEEILERATPKKFEDYFTDKELEFIINEIKDILRKEVTPIKGKDYFDGETPNVDDIVDRVLEKMPHDEKEELPPEVIEERFSDLEAKIPTIEAMVAEIKKKKLLELKDIKGARLDGKFNMNDQRWHGSGGQVDSVVAGDFISVDNTNPQAPIVSWDAPVTTKGDLLTYSTTPDRLAAGTNNYILVADSTTPTGLRWDNGSAISSLYVLKAGDTMSGDLDMGGNDISNVTTIEIGSGATDTTLSRLSAGVLGVEGIEVPTISSTSTLTNKTIGQTNTIDVLDTLFTISDNADPTKIAKFQCSGIATGTTRTYNLPNTSSTLATLGNNQTFTGQMTFSANTNSFGTGTGTGTQSFASGATTNGSTKTVNIGTGGVSGSTTDITIGSSVGGATTNVTSYGTWAHTGDLSIGTTGVFTAGTIELGAVSDTTISRASAGQIAVEGVNVLMNGGALGTPSSGTVTNLTGTASININGTVGATTPTTGSFTTVTTSGNIELGHASDTTISRSSAGVIAVEGVTVPTISSTNTLTNKRITKRVGSTTSSATPTINTDDYDEFMITALSTAITSLTTNLSGTPTERQEFTLYIKDDGTARAITPGASFGNYGAIIPTTTTPNKWLTIKFIWFSQDSIWGCVSAVEQA